MNKIQDAFETVKADDKLKAAALQAVRKKINEESLKEEKSRNTGKNLFGRKFVYAASICCVLIFAVGIFGFYSVYTSPASYVSIDINPSIELVLNRFNVVIESNAYNDDGEAIVENVDVNNLSYEKAIDKLLESEEFSGYFEKDYELVFTVISDNQEELITGIENTRCYQKYGSACVAADYETREEAQEYGMSFGKYKAYQELLNYYPDMTPEECNELSMYEIKNLILQNGGEWNGNSQNEDCSAPSENKGQNSGLSGKGENGKGEQETMGSGNGLQDGSGSGEGSGSQNGSGKGDGTGTGRQYHGGNQKGQNSEN